MKFIFTSYEITNAHQTALLIQQVESGQFMPSDDRRCGLRISRVTRKPTMWFPTRSDTSRARQAQKMTRGWKCWVKQEEELYCPCSENKGADQLRILQS